MAKVSQAELDRWHLLNATDVISKLADYAKVDETFSPIKDSTISRWNVRIRDRGGYELLVTGPKYYDQRAKTGGGSAIDLVMYLYGIDFKTAASMLRQKGI